MTDKLNEKEKPIEQNQEMLEIEQEALKWIEMTTCEPDNSIYIKNRHGYVSENWDGQYSFDDSGFRFNSNYRNHEEYFAYTICKIKYDLKNLYIEKHKLNTLYNDKKQSIDIKGKKDSTDQRELETLREELLLIDIKQAELFLHIKDIQLLERGIEIKKNKHYAEKVIQLQNALDSAKYWHQKAEDKCKNLELENSDWKVGVGITAFIVAFVTWCVMKKIGG